MNSDLAAQIANLRDGDHLCLIYDRDPAEQMTALLPFIREGLSKNEQFIYIADDQTVDQVLSHLRVDGVDVDAETELGRLKVWTRKQWRQPGELSSEKKAEQVRGFVKQAAQAGFKGIRFAVEMTWTLGPDISAAQLAHWEATINTLFTPDFPGRIICQYSRARLSPEVLLAALHTHPLALLGSQVCPNSFYEAPLILDGTSARREHVSHFEAKRRVDWMIGQLQRARDQEEKREELQRHQASAAEAERLNQLLSLIPAGVYSCDAEGKINYYNKRAEELWGRAPKLNDPDEKYCAAWKVFALDGTPIAPERRPMAFAVLDGKTCRNAEAIVERPDGSKFVASINIDVLRDSEGNIAGAINVFQDITALKQAVETIRLREQNFHAIIDHTPECVKVVGPHGTLLEMNAAGLRLVEAENLEQVLGRNICDLIAPEFREEFRALNRAVCAGKNGELEFEIIGLKGTRRWMHMVATPIVDPSSGATVQLSIANDVTRRRDENLAAQRLAAIVESSDDAIIAKDLNGIIFSWNKGAERIFGYTAEEAVGKPVLILIPPDRQIEEPDILRRIRMGERIDHFETVRRRKDGTLLEISLTISPIKDSEGKIIGASKIARDITEKKRLERQQRVLFDLVATINRAPTLGEICTAAVDAIRQSQDAQRAAILLSDESGVMRFMAWSGLSDEYRRALEGHSPWKPGDPNPQAIWIDDIAQGPMDETLRSVVQREGIRALAFIPLLQQGRLAGKLMLYYDAPRHFARDELRPALTIASQVMFAIERHRAGEALEKLVDERTVSLREAIGQMEEFSYTVSHDLRAPLRGMLLYSETLLEEDSPGLSEESKHCLRRIAANARRLDKMVLDVLTFSRLARSDFRLEKIPPGELVRRIVEQYPGLQPPHAEIQIESLPLVLAHEPSLTQAFSNLLNNAVKFVRPSVKPKIRVWGRRNNGHVRLWVEDNGIGIDPRYQHRLFKMFERIHPDLKYDGTGVGLAIVRKAVERMGGKVGVESDGVNGSKFWLEIRAAEEN